MGKARIRREKTSWLCSPQMSLSCSAYYMTCPPEHRCGNSWFLNLVLIFHNLLNHNRSSFYSDFWLIPDCILKLWDSCLAIIIWCKICLSKDITDKEWNIFFQGKKLCDVKIGITFNVNLFCDESIGYRTCNLTVSLSLFPLDRAGGGRNIQNWGFSPKTGWIGWNSWS